MSENIVAQVQEAIAQVAQPLVERLNWVEREVAAHEQELAELKKARTQLRNVIKGIDPSLVPSEEKAKKKTKSWTPKADSLEAMREFLLTHVEEVNGNGGFHAAGLTANYPKELPIPYSTIHKVLAMLHEQGVIRLDSTGTGGAKFYKVVT